jgi:hypothetical protein
MMGNEGYSKKISEKQKSWTFLNAAERGISRKITEILVGMEETRRE